MRRTVGVKWIRYIWLVFILVGLTACTQRKSDGTVTSYSPLIESSNQLQSNSIERTSLVSQEKEEHVSLKFSIDGKEFIVLAENTPTLEALIEELPKKFSMNDLHRNEKYVDLPQGLPTDSKPVERVQVGDVMLFGDRTLVIFYQSFSTSYHYTRIGSIKNSENLGESLGRGTIEVQVVR